MTPKLAAKQFKRSAFSLFILFTILANPVTMLAFTNEDRWELGIGDPTFMGWFTVVAYFAGAFLCWKCAQRERRLNLSGSSTTLFWYLLSLALFFLGINKQLDLQTWFTLFFRHLAVDEGWYEYRRVIQLIFIGCIAIAGLLTLLLLCWLTRKSFRRHFLALFGIVFLTCFVLIRASSFHHIDRMLGMEFGGLRINWILELSGIGFVITAALIHQRAFVLEPRSTANGARTSSPAARSLI